MDWFGTLFLLVLGILYVFMIFGSFLDDAEKKRGIQKRNYISGKAGLKYKAPGDHESYWFGILIIVMFVLIIVGLILNA